MLTLFIDVQCLASAPPICRIFYEDAMTNGNIKSVAEYCYFDQDFLKNCSACCDSQGRTTTGSQVDLRGTISK